MEIGKRIREARLKEGLTQEALATIIGIGESTIRAIETGRSLPSGQSLRKITEHPQFKKHAAFLMGADETPAEPEETELMELFRQVSDAGMEDQATEYLRFLISKRSK